MSPADLAFVNGAVYAVDAARTRAQAVAVENGRIVAVGDVFDAITTDRPYRRAMDSQAAFAELRRCAGGQFDPNVLDAFFRVWRARDKTTGVPAARDAWQTPGQTPGEQMSGLYATPARGSSSPSLKTDCQSWYM